VKSHLNGQIPGKRMIRLFYMSLSFCKLLCIIPPEELEYFQVLGAFVEQLIIKIWTGSIFNLWVDFQAYHGVSLKSEAYLSFLGKTGKPWSHCGRERVLQTLLHAEDSGHMDSCDGVTRQLSLYGWLLFTEFISIPNIYTSSYSWHTLSGLKIFSVNRIYGSTCALPEF
jgi:hypothetical protein